jgi:hypothetical protein
VRAAVQRPRRPVPVAQRRSELADHAAQERAVAGGERG